MTLTLEITGPQAAQLGAAARKVFAASGGSIGRDPDNDWVIPDRYISGHHARIHCRDGRYFIEDTSTNGVFVRTPGNRLTKGQLHALESGERVFIDAYEIRVTVTVSAAQASGSVFGDLFGASAAAPPRVDPFIPEDPFGAPGPAVTPPPFRESHQARDIFSSVPTPEPESIETGADPLQLLGLAPKPVPNASPRAADLAGRSPLHDPFIASPTTPLPEPAGAVVDALIPDDYDPLSDGRPVAARPPPAAIPTSGRQRAPTPASPPSPPPKAPASVAPAAPNRPPSEKPAPPPVLPQVTPASRGVAARSQVASSIATGTHPSVPNPASTGQYDLRAALTGAGVPDAQITPELAESFGRILRVVVAGLMDVLRSRSQIKDEFRLRTTTFKAADNNPLKFSVNVEDALHNLLVKRNAAYLGPVEAFEDAFDDVRHHQMAMLAGMRVAFDAMLNHFEPDRMQEQFDKQLKRGSLLAVPGKLRYWELYREGFRDMVKDPEASFRELFGEEFAKAYEEQLQRLKTAQRHQKK